MSDLSLESQKYERVKRINEQKCDPRRNLDLNAMKEEIFNHRKNRSEIMYCVLLFVVSCAA